MNSKLIGASLLMGAALTSATSALAAHHEAPVVATRSFVETFTCDYREGKSMADLQPVIDRWNGWMDGRPVNGYSAYTLVPGFHSDTNAFDIGWLGATQDATTWGVIQDDWVANGGDIGLAFYEVIECNSHTSFTVINTKPPVDFDAWTQGPTRFADCTMADGMRVEEAVDLLKQWGAYQGGLGMKGGNWMFFPHYGENPEASYDFKLVSTDASYAEMGKRVDQFWADGGGNDKARELAFGRISCDTPRLYSTTRHRLAPAN